MQLCIVSITMHMQLYMCMHLSSAVRASELHAVYDEDIKLI